MLKRKTAIIALSVLLVFMTVACAAGNNNPPPPTPAQQPQTPSNNELGIDLFVVPDMTGEQLSFYADYVRKLLSSGLLIVDWSVEDYSALVGEQIGRLGNYMIFAFEDITGYEEMRKLFDEYEGVFPAGVIEDVLLARFPFSAEQLRRILYHLYDADTNTYHYEGGRGGGPIDGAVVDVNADGEFVRLSYELFTGYSGLDIEPDTYLFKRPGVLTLKQNPDGSHMFWSVETGDMIEAPTVN